MTFSTRKYPYFGYFEVHTLRITKPINEMKSYWDIISGIILMVYIYSDFSGKPDVGLPNSENKLCRNSQKRFLSKNL